MQQYLIQIIKSMFSVLKGGVTRDKLKLTNFTDNISFACQQPFPITQSNAPTSDGLLFNKTSRRFCKLVLQRPHATTRKKPLTACFADN